MKRQQLTQQKTPRQKKRSTTFITGTLRDGSPSSFTRVMQLYSKLNELIDSLQGKVDEVVCRNEAQFFTAYKRHIQKVRKELQQIKQKSSKQQKALNSNSRMKQIQKQIIIFRQQALVLYQKLKQKDQDYDQLKLRYQQSIRQNKFLENQLKTHMKKNKNIEAHYLGMVGRNIQQNKATQTQLNNAQEQRLNQIVKPRGRSFKLSHKTQRQNSLFIVKSNIQNQYKQIFINCVQNVRKQMNRRRILAMNNKPKHITDYGSMYTNGKRQELTSKVNQYYKRDSIESFKLGDYHQILKHLIFNQHISKKLQELIFES